MKQKKKKAVGSTALLIFLFLAGLSLLLYPTVSNYVNSLHQSKAIQGYTQNVSDLDEESYARLWDEANQYNQALSERRDVYSLPDELLPLYEEMLNISGNGIMGYVEIPRINCTLPIYHGTDEAVLQVAIGHLEWSSLPVGGESTHSVISGHRGLPSAELLTHIDRLTLGDRFYIHVLNQVLEYRVDNIAVVEPEDVSLLHVTEGKDYLTLVTCTPYGINSHRLLVRGERIASSGAAVSGTIYINNEIQPVHLMYVIPVVLVLVILVAGALFWVQETRRKRRRGIPTDKQEQRLEKTERTYGQEQKKTE